LTSPHVGADRQLAESVSIGCSPCSRPRPPARRVLPRGDSTPYEGSQRRSASHPRGPPDRPRAPTRSRLAARACRSAHRATGGVDRFLAAFSRRSARPSRRPRTDVVVVADGGGLVARPVVRIEGGRGGGFLIRGLRRDFERARLAERVTRNPLTSRTRRHRVACVENGRITRIYAIRNPHNLDRTRRGSPLSHGRKRRVPRAPHAPKSSSARESVVDGVDEHPMPTRRLLSQRAVGFRIDEAQVARHPPEHVEHGGGASAFRLGPSRDGASRPGQRARRADPPRPTRRRPVAAGRRS